MGFGKLRDGFATKTALPLLAVLTVVATTAALLTALNGGNRGLLITLGGGLAAAILLTVPVHTLPTIALCVMVLLPGRLLDAMGFPISTPGAIVLGIWALRRAGTKRTGFGIRPPISLSVPVLLFLLWSALHTLASSAPSLSLNWTLTFTLAVALPLLVRGTYEDITVLRASFPWIATAAATLAIVQGAAQANFLYDPLYSALGLESVQHWEVYRADASFAHPLTAALFFSVGLAFCAGRWIETRRRTFALAAALQASALVLTVSRGAYIAAAASVLFVVLAGVFAGRRFSRGRSLVIALGFGVFAVVALQSELFVQRTLSEEASSSTEARNALVQISLEAAASTNWVGGGVAASTVVAAPFNFLGLPIESAYLQLLLGVGVPGLVLFFWLLLALLIRAVRVRNIAAAGGLVAFAVSVGGYASMDTNMPVLVLFGLLSVLCWTDLRGGPHNSADAFERARRASEARL